MALVISYSALLSISMTTCIWW